MELVSVIIVTHNQKNLLFRCLDSVRLQSYPKIEILVIDDYSQDGTFKEIKDKFSNIKIIVNEDEKLLSSSQNIGIKNTQGRFIFFLENDVILEENYTEELVKTFEYDPRIGMVVGKILRMDRITLDSTGLFLGRSRKPIERGFNQKDNGQYMKSEYIFGVGQVAGIFRRELLEDIKLDGEYFDENYGIFYEDLDLAWRANLLGWKAYYNPKAVAYHIRGATTRTRLLHLRFFNKYYLPCISKNLQFHYIKNRYMTIIKNESLMDYLKNIGYILLYELKLWTYILFFYPEIFLKLPQIIKSLGIAFRKRKSLRLLRKSHFPKI
ncbi:MAG: glycosyltransferase family 2 protein [Candidatus Omnitrophica bacterium]|nr:glycosyltransferase family 2 protein [Candidatus Omnitrophota bacterium]